ncbi:putative centlein [Triplophysa rosa]|uniref:Centlein n=1 Tax=Triplophysa rosa TaxID=992332 RepID=A0A9W7T4I6_TRIRA|nr:putative centlein [Triplophysa rosa]
MAGTETRHWREQLLFEEVPEEEVRRSSTPIKTARRVEQTFKKIEQLQTQMVSLESEIVRLRDDNQALQEMNRGLAGERGDMQAEIQLLQQRAVVRAAEDTQARAERDRLLAQLQNFKREAESAIKVANQARSRLLKLRQELGVLRAERDFHRSSALSKAKAFALTNNRFRSRKASSGTGAHSKQNRMDSPSKDDWEDMSADSENEEFSDSLESRYSAPTSQAPRRTKVSRYMLICPIDRPEEDLRLARSHTGNIQFQGPSRQMSRRRKKQTSGVLRQRLLSLQQQVTALQADKRAAQQLATEQNRRHAQAQVQLDSLLKQLSASKQLSKVFFHTLIPKQSNTCRPSKRNIRLLKVWVPVFKNDIVKTRNCENVTPCACVLRVQSVGICETRLSQSESRTRSDRFNKLILWAFSCCHNKTKGYDCHISQSGDPVREGQESSDANKCVFRLMNVCLLFEEVPEEEVRRSSTPIKTARRVEQTFKKIEQLQTQMVSLESEIVRLRDDNQALQEMNRGLAGERGDMQAEIQLLQQRAVVRAAEDTQARAERDRLLAQLQNFKREAESAIKVANQARSRLLKLRQELGVLRAERDFHRSSALSKAKAFALTNNRFRSRKASSGTGAHSKQNRMDSPSKDDWEDMSADSENEEFSDSLESRYSAPTSQAPRRTKVSRYMLICPIDRPEEDLRLARSHTGNIQFQGPSRQMSRRRKKQTSGVLRQRLLSLQQQVTALQADKRAAQQLATEQNRRHAQAQVQLDSLLKQLSASKQLSKKQACELAGVEQQKASLKMELEQWRQIRQQMTANPPAVDPEHLQTQVKQLTHQLKSTSSEMSKHSAANKSLRAQLDERDQTVKELHERVSMLERDVTMKRQLLEDLRSRLKICQVSERSHRALTEDLEKKIISLSEESTNRKALVDSLKRRLTVATEEKKQHMTTSQKLKEELQKREQRLAVLQARVAECDQAMAELEQAASKQMHGLVQQSTQTLEIMQSKLTLAESQLHQLRTFIEALAHEVAREVDDTKARLRRKQKSLNEGNRVPKCSLEKAASILNMTETDLVDMLETDECEEACAGRGAETNWTELFQQILQQQIPSAGLLMDAMLVKMKEGKVLTEELAALQAAVSKNA